MASLYRPIQIRTCGTITRRNTAKVFCSMEMPPPSQSTIKVPPAVVRILGEVEDISSTHNFFCLLKKNHLSRLLLSGPPKKSEGKQSRQSAKHGEWSLQEQSILSV
jgi:hypothetical protein